MNPYTFVGLPAQVLRAAPSFHAGVTGDELFSGSIAVTWKMQTPCLLPPGPHDWSKRPEAKAVIPGSSLKGAIRSMHETLFSGCLRILDDAFVPGYRDTARASDMTNMTLAVVSEVADGMPTRLQVCDNVLWVDATQLASRWPRSQGLPKSGDIVDIDWVVEDTTLGRVEMRQVTSAAPDREARRNADGETAVGSRVLLVTDVGARRAFKRDRTKGRALWATGRVTQESVELDPHDQAIVDLRNAGQGTDDARKAAQKRRESPPPAATPEGQAGGPPSDLQTSRHVFVEWWGPSGVRQPVAQRQLQTNAFEPGDVLWITRNGPTIERISLSVIWRVAGRGGVAKRLGHQSLSPCTGHDPQHEGLVLCLSCAIFGSADTSADQGGGEPVGQGSDTKARQTSYAGHVRFSSAVSSTSVRPKRVTLTPLGAPNPGSGMFYLANRTGLPEQLKMGDPATRWGSAADQPQLRQLAGRKFYWHTDPDAQSRHWTASNGRHIDPRYVAAGKQRTGQMARTAYLVPTGTEFTATITFDRLTAMDLHTLLAAIDPARVLGFVPNAGPDRRYAVHLGGGKPLGLGSASPTITSIDVQTAEERYLGVSRHERDWRPTVAALRAIAARVGRFTSALPSVAKILDVDGLGAWVNHVAYPPAREWDAADTDDFRLSYQFFQEVNGEQLQGGRRPWLPLPGPTDPDPSLPITRRQR